LRPRIRDDPLRLGSCLLDALARLGFRTVRRSAGVDDDVRSLGPRLGSHLFGLTLRGSHDLSSYLVSLRENGAPFLLGALERVGYRISRRVRCLQFRDQAVDPRDIRIDCPTLVAAARDREGDIANCRRNASVLTQPSTPAKAIGLAHLS